LAIFPGSQSLAGMTNDEFPNVEWRVMKKGIPGDSLHTSFVIREF